MGCMEHHCTKCDKIIINNNPKVSSCPSCGAPMYRLCDEVFEAVEWDGDDPQGEEDEHDYGRWGSEDL